MRSGKIATWAVLLILLSATAALAGPEVRLDRIDEGEILSIGFEISKDAEGKIEAAGYIPRESRDYSIYGWLIDAKTRQPVWDMSEERGSRSRKTRRIRNVDDDINLAAGKYELYFYAFDHRGYWSSGKDFFNYIGRLFDRDDDDLDEAFDECFVSISFPSLADGDLKTYEVSDQPNDALIRLTQMEDDEYIKRGFELKKEMELKIYMVTEFPSGRRNPVDNAWIMDTKTRDRVWEVDRYNTDWAGGGEKNQYVEETVTLPAGKYVLFYISDDSHSFERFNTNPPYDPLNWGITISAVSSSDKNSFALYDADIRRDAVIALDRARDDRYYEQPFRMKKDGEVGVIAIGEYSDGSREFVDRGWIQDAINGKTVWEMTYRNTVYAGGGEKNRMFDGTIDLSKGDYILCYATDGSHSYRDWNDDPPIEQDLWGISLYLDDANKGVIEEIDRDDLEKNSDILAQLVRIRDNEDRHTSFELDKESDVHVYALGEGSNGGMYDYGWIENAKTGRIVWEMTYRRTDHAGGAKKNRIFDHTIKLPAGEYDVYYVSDGSHSFRDWNDRRPYDPVNWGITISKAK